MYIHVIKFANSGTVSNFNYILFLFSKKCLQHTKYYGNTGLFNRFCNKTKNICTFCGTVYQQPGFCVGH